VRAEEKRWSCNCNYYDDSAATEAAKERVDRNSRYTLRIITHSDKGAVAVAVVAMCGFSSSKKKEEEEEEEEEEDDKNKSFTS
jgi:hypothetical protein